MSLIEASSRVDNSLVKRLKMQIALDTIEWKKVYLKDLHKE